MKCKKCGREMERKDAGNGIFYYECPRCGNSLGKPVENTQGSNAPTIAQGDK